ncbi:MAG: hypothetical protein Q8N59_01535 [bacterium]|nr:hypothetical protein [bacterium]
MAKKITKSKKDLEIVKKNLEKTGEAVGGLFTSLFKGIGKILDVAQDMEMKGEKERGWKKEIKGVTKSGKEFRGEAGWRVKTDLLESIPKKTKTEKRK